MSLFEELTQLEIRARKEFASIKDAETLETLKLKYLSRKGELAVLSSRLKEVSAAEKPEAGKIMNQVKKTIQELFDSQSETSSKLTAASKGIDTTMPPTATVPGSLHPLTQVIEEICDIFSSLGFRVATGPEMETERNNFEALNIPKDHPSRDGGDTFYLDNHLLLRSQTSTVQIRAMEKSKPPLKIIAPGRVYRPDATDATHSFMFHQIEGLMVDENVSFADLKGILMAFSTRFFGSQVKMRFRPHHFPFTEPSAEVDVSCDIWGVDGGSAAKKKWLEILGAGMVHPNVLKQVNIDSDKYSGFAFGMGVERIAMLRWGVKDIRLFYENDLRFLRQFR